MNKKKYTSPACIVVTLQHVVLLAGSPDVPYDPNTQTEEILAPQLDVMEWDPKLLIGL
jgi:hypothetical protein